MATIQIQVSVQDSLKGIARNCAKYALIGVERADMYHNRLARKGMILAAMPIDNPLTAPYFLGPAY